MGFFILRVYARLDKKANGQFSSLCFLFGYNILPFLVILEKNVI
jgi:hypothetical protein